MVTELRKTIVRRTASSFDHRKRRLLVKLEVGDVLNIKEERTRKWFTAPISRVFHQMVLWNINAEKIIRKLRRK